MAQPLMQTVSLSVSHVGLTTAVGPGLLSSLFFAEAGLAAPVASPFFKPAEGKDEPLEPVAIQACPWLPPQMPVSQRLIRLALRAAHEALDAHLDAQDAAAPRPGVWLIVPAERPGVTAATISDLNATIWKELRPRNVRVFTDETGTMQAIQEIAQVLNAGEASALLLAVDSYFCAETAALLVAEPTSPWEPTPPTPSEAAAAVLFTGKGSRKTSLSASRSSTLGFSQVSAPPSVDPMSATALATSRLSSTALGAGGSSGIARVVSVGAATGLATESNDELQDGLAMTALLEGLNQAVRPDVVLGPSQLSVFRSREWEMAACRAPSKLGPEHQELDVSSLFGWVGAASPTVALVYAIAATRLGLLQPKDGNWLTAAVWSLAPSGARGLLGVMTEAQTT
ncbi:MAG: hypothetical protein AB7K71_00360 [Polyangiaceae bacterium]